MNWQKIDRNSRIQQQGKYNNWKEQIAKDCFHRCVYCSIHESPWGGIDNFHIDHFKPKSKFSELTNVIYNLYYSCPICNRFKSDDWQNDCIANLDVIGYPDPSEHDFQKLFEIDMTTFKLKGNFKSSRYVINRLYLNRPQLILERREFFLNKKAEILISEFRDLVTQKNLNRGFLKKYIELSMDLSLLILKRNEISPYRLVDIRK
ncbi:HNH endonuclease [Sphingobacterium sp. UME9]|uniref:HNH endonuclease n=1 Tax=Sphingobacterium sp. UME9 TaxID=1862316 RepID=UPI0015FFAD07|nr:HNH endonuclease [Sphingobacterium sp. UME9]MBB1644948.1 hypothetical protein [Sphingobacterium sp. UME9]